MLAMWRITVNGAICRRRLGLIKRNTQISGSCTWEEASPKGVIGGLYLLNSALCSSPMCEAFLAYLTSGHVTVIGAEAYAQGRGETAEGALAPGSSMRWRPT